MFHPSAGTMGNMLVQQEQRGVVKALHFLQGTNDFFSFFLPEAYNIYILQTAWVYDTISLIAACS